MTAEQEGQGARLRGVLSVDGGVAARAERRPDEPPEIDGATDALLRELLVTGSLAERPLFWVALGVGLAAIAGAAAAAILVPPDDTQTNVGFFEAEIGP